MEYQHQKSENSGLIVVMEEGEQIGQINYSGPRQNTIIIHHTEVDERFRGGQIGRGLVEETVRFARKEGLKIQPVCAFARAVFEKEGDFSDVRA